MKELLINLKLERYKSQFIQLGVNVFILLIFWGGMLRKGFNADTVSHMASYDGDMIWNISDGRYVIALADAILLKFGVKITDNLSISMLLTFLFLAVTMLIIQNILQEWQPKEKWCKVGFFCGINLVFTNVLFAEVLMFSEVSLYYAIGYLLVAVGVKHLTKKKIIPSFFLFCFAVCIYQYTMIFAAILVAFLVCLRYNEELNLKAVKVEMMGIFFCIGVGGLNYLSIRILQKIGIINKFNKDVEAGNFEQKTGDLVESFIDLNRSSLDILPDLWLPLLFILGGLFLLIYSCIKEKKIKKILFIGIVFAGSVILLYGIPMVQVKFNFPPRMAFCYYLVQGMLMVVAYAVSTLKAQKLLSALCVVYVMIQLLFADFVVTNHFVSNTLDEVYTNMAYQEIIKYENEMGMEVTKICVYKDAYAPDNYEEVNYHVHQINERALGTVTVSLLQKISGRYFEKIENQEEIYNEYFKDKDWDYFDLSEQLVIIGDTVYWCIF